MLMEMKLIYNQTFFSKESLPEKIASSLEGTIIEELNTGLKVQIIESEDVSLYNLIYNNAKEHNISVFERKRFYATVSIKVTEKDVNCWENHIDPYYEHKDIGTWSQISGQQFNTKKEGLEYIKNNFPERFKKEQVKIVFHEIEDDIASVS